jgi:hypothetical protein
MRCVRLKVDHEKPASTAGKQGLLSLTSPLAAVRTITSGIKEWLLDSEADGVASDAYCDALVLLHLDKLVVYLAVEGDAALDVPSDSPDIEGAPANSDKSIKGIAAQRWVPPEVRQRLAQDASFADAVGAGAGSGASLEAFSRQPFSISVAYNQVRLGAHAAGLQAASAQQDRKCG